MSETKKVIKSETIEQITDLLNDDDFKKKLIKAINDDVDIPMLNEKTEKKIFNSLYKLISSKILEAIHN